LIIRVRDESPEPVWTASLTLRIEM
jgi:hypothetical protein